MQLQMVEPRVLIEGLILRILTIIDVFNNADYFASHPHLTATE